MNKFALLVSTAAIGHASAPAAAAPAAAKPAVKRVDPVLSEVVTFAVPAPTRGGGAESAYPFATLEVGQAFGVKSKDKRGMSSIVSAQNRKHKIEMKDATGAVVGHNQTKHFFVVDVDAALAKQIKGTPLEGFTTLVSRDK